MLHKVLIFFICFSLILGNESALAQTRMLRLTPRHALYYYAERGNIEQLTVLKQKYTLELLDNQKNTALCEGIIKNNQTAVYSLLEVGADKNAECVKKILTKNTSPLTTSKAEGLSIGTKVGIGAGIVALIGGVALAAGGGGGGGSPSSSESDNNTDNQEPDDDGSNDKDEPSTPCPYHTTSCTGGYIETGNTCNENGVIYKECQINPCHGYTSTCANGYTQQLGDICYSGDMALFKCEPNDCSGHQLSCGSGYNATESCLSGATQYYTCTPKDVPSGYTPTACREGYDTADTLISGETTYYKCTPTDCSGHQSSCGAGYNATASCLSGTTQYYTCTPKEVPSDYTATPCGNGYDEVDTFVSGETTYYKCQANRCSDFELTECPTNANCSSCQSGSVEKYQIVNCKIGYTGEKCQTFDETNYIIQDGVIYEKLTCGTNAHQFANNCVCNAGYGRDGNGMCTVKVNSKIGINRPTNNTSYELYNTDYTDVYGMVYFSGKNATDENSALIDLKNYSDGNVFGMSTQEGLALQPGNGGYHLYNATDYADGYIAISNDGEGDVYGMYSSNRAYNAYGEAMLFSNGGLTPIGYSEPYSGIRINNTGNGNVHGIYALIEAANIYSDGEASLAINNTGNGSIYGIYGKESAMNAFYDFYMTYSPSGLKRASVEITNIGNGSVYGIYSENSAYNSRYNQLDPTYSPTVHPDAVLSIFNVGNGDIYGLYGKQNAWNLRAPNMNNWPTIKLGNYGNGKAVGMYAENINSSSGIIRLHNLRSGLAIGMEGIENTNMLNNGSIFIDKGPFAFGISQEYHPETPISGTAIGMYAKGGSSIKNEYYIDITGAQNAYGLYGSGKSTITNLNSSHIDINNSKNVYGLYGGLDSQVTNYGHIIIDGAKNAIGMYGSDVYSKEYDDEPAENIIDIHSIDGKSVGMYGTKSISNLKGNININFIGANYTKTYVDTEGITQTEDILNADDTGVAIGIYADIAANVTSAGDINITRNAWTDNKQTVETNDDVHYIPGAGSKAYGIYVRGRSPESFLVNTGKISISDVDEAYGIFAEEGSNIENSGTIVINNAQRAIGIYVGPASTVTNSGTIEINNAENTVGIWAADKTVTVTNTGTIKLNGRECSGDCSGGTTNGNYIVLNGGSLLNAGIITSDSLNFDAFGGNVVATNTSKFNVKDDLSGTLNIADTSVQKGFDTTYQLTDVIQAGNTDNLKLVSQSALFNAELSDNKHDIVMTMKSFDELTDNKSLASFLEKNYASGNNEAFFNDIKSIGNASAFTSAMDSLTGRDTIAKFTHKDLTAMREVNFAMNELMFANNDKPMFETNGSLNTFNFKNDNNSSARYALANKRISPRMKIGYAMSTTNLNTDNDDDTTRRNSVFQVFAPISYDRSGWQMIATPQIGFARGHYTRKGYNGTSYEGVIEKRIFALMNEARYPMTVGKFEVSPTVEFNAIAYNTKGSEDEKAYSLTMPSDNSLSVEAGLGIYAKRNIGNMKFNAGLMVYREFADPYNIKMGMNGMEGTFDLYEDRNEYRGVASFGFGYDIGKLNVYGNVQHFMETDTNTKFKAGLKFGF